MADTTLNRHPIRGLIWGLLFGLGVARLLMVFSIVAVSIPTLIIVTVVVAIVGSLWGLFAPPKRPKGEAPTYAFEDLPPAVEEAPPMVDDAMDAADGMIDDLGGPTDS